MDLGQRLEAVGDHARSESFEVFRQHLEPTWIDAALKTTGTLSLRRRRLPAESAVWTVIGMALLRDRSIQEVVTHLWLVLPTGDKPATITGSAIIQTRDRLGEEPLVALFAQLADHWVDRSADQNRWRGLRVYGVDGTTLRIPDTRENEDAFGRPKSGRGRSGYPQVRLVAVMVLRSHELASLSFGRYSDSELTLAEPLWSDPMLVLADEPTGTLDAETGRKVMDLFGRLLRERGKTLLIVTHSKEVTRFAERVLTLEDGQLTAHAPEAVW